MALGRWQPYGVVETRLYASTHCQLIITVQTLEKTRDIQTDRRTDGRTDGRLYHIPKLSFLLKFFYQNIHHNVYAYTFDMCDNNVYFLTYLLIKSYKKVNIKHPHTLDTSLYTLVKYVTLFGSW